MQLYRTRTNDNDTQKFEKQNSDLKISGVTFC
jgi:hypothetical protein